MFSGVYWLCIAVLLFRTTDTQDITMVILIEGGGAYHSVAFAAVEAVGMVVFVTVACTLAHDALLTHDTMLGKLVSMALFTEWLVVVGDKGDVRQLGLATRTDKAF